MQHNNQKVDEKGPESRASRKRKQRSPRWIGWTIALVIMIVCITCAVFGYCHYKNVVHEEQEFAVLGANNFDVGDYEAFLEKYPESEHSAEVKTRLAHLRTMHATWANIYDCNSLQSFRQFAKEYPYPTCEYYLVCLHKIDSLEWIEAQRVGTSEALNRYCRLHPEGDYLIDAELLLDSIEKVAWIQETQMIDSLFVDSI